ncbi:MAG: DEAD/DEAH box helicase [Verrucomicrobiaceae bacterium]|nr:DEAD/DEAH box helicase [Verrucomicrobiaceae bacterium]
MKAFDQLHPAIREAIWRQSWKELRPLQVDAIEAVLGSKAHLILSAATASGKTEAAFLPILSSFADAPSGGVKALYISPLKALINDQFQRLRDFCEAAQIPVHRWHGDVSATDKRKLRDDPGGVLLITPESLESHCINHGPTLHRIYHGLEFIVIDELHAFLEDVRGVHLRSLIARICHAAGCSPRLLGLSATLGDFAPAQRFLCAEKPADVRVLKEEGGDREIRVGVKTYIRPAKVEGVTLDELTAERAVATDIATRFRKATNLIFFNSRGLTEEIADLLNERCKSESWPVNPFRVHHGSLSKDLREATEAELKSNQPITALCTRTLEMGIDIGAVQCVGQVGAPWTVASLIQRVGRSGRREGEAQMLRFYVIDAALTDASTFSERLFPETLRAIAMVELLLQKWVETPKIGRKHYSTFIHQILSILRQTGGARADALHHILCQRGAFDSITTAECAAVLRSLAGHSIIQQMETGEIILAPDGEQIVESRDFYAAFASSTDYSIEHDSDKIGVMPRDQLPPVGEHLLLGGRRWCVIDINDSAKRASVIPARGKRVPLFLGGAGSLDRRVMQKMKELLTSSEMPAYLHSDAAATLKSARGHYEQMPDSGPAVFETHNGVCFLPWEGTAIHKTLVSLAKADGLEAALSRDGLMITYGGCTLSVAKAHWQRVSKGAFKSNDLVSSIGDPTSERFDDLVPPDLLANAYISEFLDVSGARDATENLRTTD